MELDGASALVTGGASGIGAATVGLLRGAGARVAVLDVQEGPDPAELWVRCDISVEEEVVAAVHRVHDTFGGLDVAVLNAGVGGFGALVDLPSREWDRVIGVNLRGTFLCLREVAKAMVAGGRGGAIVAVSSISGFLADRLMGHYSVSKAGVAELVRVAARELGPFGIRVNAVAPGTTDTPMFASTTRLPGYRERVAERSALGDVGTPEGVARAITALLDLDWVTGQVLAADGGVSLWSPIDPAESMGS
ncbi:MAG TPA: SDR family oxidoreductase [Acidimicrobiales bacterium]|nr:SDR family oxidoreductase [Acidimicrobiales bacterium]